MNEILMALFEQIKHGDAEHQQWLKDKILKFAAELKPNRLEIHDDCARTIIYWHSKNVIDLQLDDDNQTLKVIITRK